MNVLFLCFFSPRFFFSFQVGNLGLLFMLLFFIFAALGVELFGDLGECSPAPCRLGAGERRLIAVFVLQSAMTHTPVRGWADTPPSATSGWPSSPCSASPPGTTGTG